MENTDNVTAVEIEFEKAETIKKSIKGEKVDIQLSTVANTGESPRHVVIVPELSVGLSIQYPELYTACTVIPKEMLNGLSEVQAKFFSDQFQREGRAAYDKFVIDCASYIRAHLTGTKSRPAESVGTVAVGVLAFSRNIESNRNRLNPRQWAEKTFNTANHERQAALIVYVQEMVALAKAQAKAEKEQAKAQG